MPPRRSPPSAASRNSRAGGAAGPSNPGRDHELPAEVKAALDAFVELVPRLLRLPGPDGLPLLPPGVTAIKRLLQVFKRFDWPAYTADVRLAALKYSRVAEIGVLLLRGDVADAAGPAQRDALTEAQLSFSFLLTTDVSGCMSQARPVFYGLVRMIGRTGVLDCIARQLAAAAEHQHTADGLHAGIETCWRACTVLQLLVTGICLCPKLEAEAEAALASSNVLQHTGYVTVLLMSVVQVHNIQPMTLAFLWHGLDLFQGVCGVLVARSGATDASRQLLAGWPLLALLTVSVAVMHDLDGGTAYGLPAEPCFSAAQLGVQTGADGGVFGTEVMAAVGSPAAVLAYGSVPLHGISRRGLLAVMLRVGRLALSAVAGGGRLTTPDDCYYALELGDTTFVAVESLCAAVQLLLPADAAAGWVREDSVAVWRLAADMARAGAVGAYAAYTGCTAACFSSIFKLLEAELLAGGIGMCACLNARAAGLCQAAVLLTWQFGRLALTRVLRPSRLPQRALTLLPRLAVALRRRWRAAARS
jgi:hypothetical protein